MNDRRWIAIGALLALVAVALGAFGAHALKEKINGATYEVGVRYHLIHALGVVLVGLAAPRCATGPLRWAGVLFVVGVLCFSGSLYALAFPGAPRWLGPITPLGGLAFMVGWLLFAWSAVKGPSSP